MSCNYYWTSLRLSVELDPVCPSEFYVYGRPPLIWQNNALLEVIASPFGEDGLDILGPHGDPYTSPNATFGWFEAEAVGVASQLVFLTTSGGGL